MSIQPELIQSLRNAAKKVDQSCNYQWGHMGLCNCGFLAQEITKLTKEEIHRRAMMRHGDWTEQLNDYCTTSNLPMDDLITELLNFGFTREQLQHLENVSDPEVIKWIPLAERNLKRNVKADVVRYLNTWAQALENQLLVSIKLDDLNRIQQEVFS
ncbi:MAG: hypothetical protein JNM78_19420 [Cyclobacteriaceae bacterium]|nr:hypothetical protein [Cyclobacteriaceae bacterium]